MDRILFMLACFYYLFHYFKDIKPSSILVYLPTYFIPWISNAWTHCLCSLIYYWGYLFLDFFLVYPTLLFSKAWNVHVRFLLLTYRECDRFSSKWLRAATIIALIAPLFLTIQAVIPLQSDILDVGVNYSSWK